MNLIFLFGIFFDILRNVNFSIILAINLIVIAIFFLHVEIRQKKVCIILDTITLQELFLEENQLHSIKDGKLTKPYKKWLLRYAINNNIDITYQTSFYENLHSLCFYCCFNLFPMLIIGMISIIYLSVFLAWIMVLIFTAFSVTFYFLMERRSNMHKYKTLDSEIKRIIFEEETGYKPNHKTKLTFKYRAWLVMNERKQTKSVFVNNI
jgi:hypothetical protein